MKINTYIHELLLENETVIIPGFGAFISHYKPAEIHPENDEIIPPGKILSFNQKIRNNDGLLVGYIAEKEGISHFDALKEIEKERENIIYQLDKGEKITFENIGVLARNPDNEIEFEPFEQENLLLDSFGLEATSLTPSEPEVEEEKQEEPEVQEKIISEAEAENSEAETEEKETEKIISEAEAENSEAETEEKETAESEETSAGKTEEENESDKEPTAFIKEQLVFNEAEPAIPQEEQKEKKKRGWVWFLLILIPIIGVGIYLYLRPNNEIPPIHITEEQPIAGNELTNEVEPAPADTAISDTATTALATAGQTEGTSTDSANTTEATSGQGIYYLVGGSFKQKENVEKFMNEFDAEGYTPFLLGKRGNFYIVAIGRYKTEDEAFASKDEFLRKNPDAGTWVYKDEAR